MKTKKPEIRFNGFEGEWVTTTLGECSKKITTKNNGNEYNVVLTNSAERGIVDQRSYFDREIVNTENIQGYYIVSQDDFVYNPRISMQAPVGPINRSKIEYTGVMSPLYYVFRITDKRFSLTYLEWFFKSSSWHNFMYKNGNSGARSDRFSINDDVFLKLPICHSKDISEQEKIGLFLTTLDKLIAKLEAKLDKLRKLKQALLEKMFVNVNRGGCETPEIRFKGYTDKWEVKELRNYFMVATERNQSEEYNKYDIYSVSREFGVINQIEYQGKSFAGASLANYGIVQTGDLVYTKSPLKSQPYGIIKTNEGEAGIVSALYGVYHPKECVHSPFTQVYFDLNSRLNNYLRPLVNKGAKNTLLISDEDSLNGRVAFPSKDEQKVIAHLFKEHSLCERKTELKLTKLRNIKQSLLQKMFA